MFGMSKKHDFSAEIALRAELAEVKGRLGQYETAMREIEAIAESAAKGYLENRINNRDRFAPEIASVLSSVNHLLDMADSYVRESAASLEYAASGRYFRTFLTTGMRGQFAWGASAINKGRLKMAELAEEQTRQRLALAENLERAVMTAADQVAREADGLLGTSRSLNQSADTSAREATSMDLAARDASAHVEAVAAASTQLVSSIQEISRQVNNSSAATHAVAEAVRNADTAVEQLTGAARTIDDVLRFIKEVADQTNLLALNATIEAARAGEAGKGFAVVASEVKGLADQTAEATKKIAAEITAMQQASSATAQAMADITERITMVEHNATAIAGAVEEQSVATGEISQSIRRASGATSELTQSVGRVRDASERSDMDAKTVVGAAQKLETGAATLTREVDRLVAELRQA